MIRTEADIARELAALLAIDPSLHPVAERAGALPLRVSPPGLRGLIGTMIGQQVSRASATAILGRLSALADLDDPAAILSLGDAEMRAAGLSRAKERTLLAIGAAAASGALDMDALSRAPPDEAIAALVQLPGIGPWTAECFLLFSLGHPDIFPAGDLALQVAVGHVLGRADRPSARETMRLAGAWAPHRSIAARLFWAFYATLTRRDAAPADGPAETATGKAPQRHAVAEKAGFTKATR
ncbi:MULTISPECIES: DNA-3-methyladenine glycosylase family protein [unclassified Aureimonas]|uniref:DNA-3-methyladenine glycosylase family protein n=1 Tax=unclassified Aureimonas TaxID=2615206 RepID=UPI0009E70474|nr:MULTISPECIES: DNA-3-methyladenine glycosylase [unclassified Aureimonas]